MAIIISLIFLLIVTCIYRYEKTYAYVITPISSLGFIYGFIMLIVSGIDFFQYRGYYIMSYKVPIYSCLYIIVFGVVGIILKRIIFTYNFNKEKQIIDQNIKKMPLKHENIYKIIMIILTIYVIIHYIHVFGFTFPLMNDIKMEFSKGLVGYCIDVISIFMLINFASSLNKKSSDDKVYKILSFIWALVLLITSAKYTMFMYVISLLFIFSYFKKEKINLRKIAGMCAILSLLFCVVYIARFLSQGFKLDEIPYDFIINHYLYYFKGSFYAFSKVIDTGIVGISGFSIVFAPVINCIRKISGKELVGTIAAFIPINMEGPNSSTNVFTLFGAMQYEVGLFGTIFLIILLSIFIYINYYKMLKSKSLIRLVLSAYLFSTLAFSFFNCFYGTLNVWVNIILLYLLIIIEKIKFLKM